MLDDLISQGAARARERWPDAPHAPADAAAFAAYVRARAIEHASLARLHVDDLFLAWWTTSGDARAITAFETTYAGALRGLLERFHRLDADELHQLIRIKLFGAPEPRIREYSGFGFLENWFKIVAARAFLDAARAQRRERNDVLVDDVLDEVAAAGDDPRDAAERAELVAVVKRALEAAIATLPGRERTFLRHITVDGLTVEQIATTYQLHRVTVSRALVAAREQLATAARALVASELGVVPARLASVLQTLDSQIDLSLQRLFPEPTL